MIITSGNTKKGGGGKALAATEKVLTPDGFKPISEIRLGDSVIGSSGTAIEVTGVFPQGVRDIYKVEFRDKSFVYVDNDHLWTVHRNKDFKRIEVLTTEQIKTSNYNKKKYDKRYGSYQNNYKYMIPHAPACEYGSDKNLKLDPYLLGLLLGDGGFTDGSVKFTNANINLIDEVEKRLPESCKIGVKYFENGAWHISIRSKENSNNLNEVAKILKEYDLLGKKSIHKHIPQEYKTSTLATRKLLVQGLIDTDGYIDKNKLREYSTSSKQLADDFLEVGRSIGMYLTIHDRVSAYKKNGKKHICSKSYRITNIKGQGKAITNIEYSHEQEAICISVDAEDNLFVINGFNLTHNSTLATNLAVELTHQGSVKVLDLDPENHASKDFFDARENNTVECIVVNTPQELIDHVQDSQEDYLILDIGGIDSDLTAAAILLTEVLLVPFHISSKDITALGRFIEYVENLYDYDTQEMQIHLVPNFVYHSTKRETTLEEIKPLLDKGYLLGTVMSYRVSYKKSALEGKSVAEYGDQAAEIEMLELRDRVIGA